MPKTPINGFEMYYEDGGSGAPVVYVHGGFASLDTRLASLSAYAWTWENDFAARFHFITYNRRGCHQSTCPEIGCDGGGYDYANQALDLALLLDHLQIPAAHIVGSSAGGPIAMTFAAQYPTRTRSLVLAGTALCLFPSEDPVAMIVRQQIRLLDDRGAEYAFDHRPPRVQVSLKALWEPEQVAARGTISEYQKQQLALEQQAALLPRAERVRHYAAELANIRAYMATDVSADARKISVPTLIVHGSDDRTIPVEWGEELAHIIPSAELRIIAGGPHSLIIVDAATRHQVIEWIAHI